MKLIRCCCVKSCNSIISDEIFPTPSELKPSKTAGNKKPVVDTRFCLIKKKERGVVHF